MLTPICSVQKHHAGRWPDFIGLGMAKSGTTWLFDMLSQHPEIEFNMPERPSNMNGDIPEFYTTEGPGPGDMPGMGPGDGSRKIIWVKNGNTIEARMVELGDTDELYYEVLSGLQDGDLVLTGMDAVGMEISGMPDAADSGTRSPFMPQRPGGGGNPPPRN